MVWDRVTEMDPLTIRVSVKELPFRFATSAHHETVTELVESIRDDRRSVRGIPGINICQDPKTSEWYSCDNKRLWVFRELGKEIPVVCKSLRNFGWYNNHFRRRPTGKEERVTIVDKDADGSNDANANVFFGIILSWSAADILNDDYYSGKVLELPYSYKDEEEYFFRLKWLLLEETRAAFKKGLEGCGSQSFEHALPCSLFEFKKRDCAQLYEKKLIRVLVTMNPGSSGRRRKDHGFGKDDLVVVFDGEANLKATRDLISNQRACVFGIVTHKSRMGDFLDVVLFPGPSCTLQTRLKSLEAKWKIIRVELISTNLRIWSALSPSAAEMKAAGTAGTMRIIHEILYTHRSVELPPMPRLLPPSENSTRRELWRPVLQRYCESMGLNGSQIDAVCDNAIGVLLGEEPRVRLVQGPPGTGKTSTSVTLLSVVGTSDVRTLVCAPSNRGIAEVALRFMQFFPKEPSASPPKQFGGLPGRQYMHLNPGDALLVGNDERLPLEGHLTSMFIDARVHKLMAAATSKCSGWGVTVDRVLEFLEDPCIGFNDKKGNMELLLDDPRQYWKKFLAYGIERLRSLCRHLISTGTDITNSLPSKVITLDVLHHMQNIINGVHELTSALPVTLPPSEIEQLEFFKSIANIQAEEDLRPDPQSDFVVARTNVTNLLEAPLTLRFDSLARGKGKEEWEKVLLGGADIIFCTIGTAGRQLMQLAGKFQCVLMDEACQVVEAESCVVTRWDGVEHVILVGDQQQLPASVSSKVARDYGYERSLFERLQLLGLHCNLLNIQYRMHPEISKFPNDEFYFGCIFDGRSVGDVRYSPAYHTILGPYAFIDVDTGFEEREPGGTSRYNTTEIGVVMKLLNKLQGVCRTHDITCVSVGVVTPYKAQRDRITDAVVREERRLRNLQIDARTVDSFQGGERDVIIMTTVVANKHSRIDFVSEERRLNVALTRARNCNWIVGHAKTLETQDIWRKLIDNAIHRKVYVLASEDVRLV